MAARRLQRVAIEVLIVAAALGLVGFAWAVDLRWFERHVLSGYCATTRGGEMLPAIVRGAALLLAMLLGLVVRPRLGRHAERSSAGEILAIIGAVAAALVVTDLLLRLRPIVEEQPPLRRTNLPHTVEDPRLAWRFVPSQTMVVQVHGRAIDYSIDADGNRAARADARIDPDLPTLILAGESIAFGESLPFEETFQAHLERDLHVQVMNVAVPAYGSDQAYLRIADALARLRRPIAVVSIFLPRQIRRNARAWRPHLELVEGQLVPTPPRATPGLARLWRDEPYHDDAPLELTRAILAATATAARAHGAAPLFVTTNYDAPCLDPDAWILGELFGVDGPTAIRVTLQPDEIIGISGDRHPNPRGARKLADKIERALNWQ